MSGLSMSDDVLATPDCWTLFSVLSCEVYVLTS